MNEKQNIIYSYDENSAYVIAEDPKQALLIIWNDRIHGYDGPVEYVRRDDGSYSWDDIYCLAANTGCGDEWLNAKDNARCILSYKIMDDNGIDIEDKYYVDCEEEEIDFYIDTLRSQGIDLMFDSSGNLI